MWERQDGVLEDRKEFLEENRKKLNAELEKRLRFYSAFPTKDGRHWHYDEDGKIEIYR